MILGLSAPSCDGGDGLGLQGKAHGEHGADRSLKAAAASGPSVVGGAGFRDI